MSRLVEGTCPRCGSDFLLEYRDKGLPYMKGVYCPECDTLFSKREDKLYPLVRTQEPYADWSTLWKYRAL